MSTVASLPAGAEAVGDLKPVPARLVIGEEATAV